MKDYQKMSKAELRGWVQKLKSRHARVTKSQQQQAQSAVRDQEERLRAILETAVEGIITIDEQGVVESANVAAERMFGYSAKEVIGRNVSMLMPLPHRTEHDTYLSNYRHTGHAKIIGIGREVAGRRKDGSVFPMELSVSEVRLADRRMFTGFIRDITERKEAEKSLLHYAAMVESSDDAIIGKDLAGNITSWNRGAQSVFGYRAKEVVGKSISVLIPKDRTSEEADILNRIRDGQSVEHYDTIRRRKDGKLINISVTISPIRNPDGKVIGASKVARDITEKKAVESALRRQAALIDLSPNANLVRRPDGTITFWSAGAEKMYGWPKSEALGQSSHQLLATRFPEPLAKITKQLKAAGRWSGELVHHTEDGREIIVQSQWLAQFNAQGKLDEILETNVEITEHKQLEKEILEISEREQRRIGHDLHDGLCQHLAGIELMCQVVEQQLTAKSDPTAERVGEIAKNVRETISQTRSLARGLSPVTLESEGLTVALRELARNTEKIFRVKCRFSSKASVQVHNHLVSANLFRIAQEAVSNAFKHGWAKTIVISLRRQPDGVILSISDNGKGFSKVDRKQNGMGLRIMQSRATSVGGKLTIHHGANGGVTVTVSAPDKTSAKPRKPHAE